MMANVNPDRPCLHGELIADVNVCRIFAHDGDQNPVAYNASITVRCVQCGEPFRWTGVQAGLSQARPMCSVDEAELRAPLRPASADPDFGMGMPGFAVTWRDGSSGG